MAVIGWSLPLSGGGPAAAAVALHDVRPAPERAGSKDVHT
jgi:hypothetical protein